MESYVRLRKSKRFLLVFSQSDVGRNQTLNLKPLNIILTLFIFIALLTSCKTVKIQGYFRTYDQEQLIYKFKTDSSFYDDTLTCKILVRNKIFWKRVDQNFDIFYFDKSNLQNSSEKENPFFGFSFCFEKGNLYAAQYFDKSPNRMSSSLMKLFIPSKIKSGDNFNYQGSDYKGTLTFIGFEDLHWHRLGLQKCLKFSYSEAYPKRTYYMWFTKKWGLIQWTKPNGDEGIMYE